MDRASNIRMKMGILLREIYELGKEEGIEEERIKNCVKERKAYNKGVDEGYNLAKEEFYVPDL